MSNTHKAPTHGNRKLKLGYMFMSCAFGAAVVAMLTTPESAKAAVLAALAGVITATGTGLLYLVIGYRGEYKHGAQPKPLGE